MQLVSRKDQEAFEAHLIGNQQSLETQVTTLALQFNKLLGLLTPRNPTDMNVPVSSVQPITVDYQGYQHLYAFSSQAITLAVDTLGTVNLVEGIWNDISFRPGTRLFALNVPASTPVVVLVRCTNSQIFPGQSGSTVPSAVTATPFAGNPTSTTASTDTPFLWGTDGTQQVNTVYLQNKTATPLWYAFNATASNGSYFLGPGLLQIWQRPVSSLHLFTTGAQTINGTGVNNIVVEGGL